MGSRDTEIGIILLIISVIFLLSGLDLMQVSYQFFDDKASILIAFVLMAIGIYLIPKK